MTEHKSTTKPHILIVTARFYEDIAQMLEQGAEAVLDHAGATYEKIEVPGALEIPSAIALCEKAGKIKRSNIQPGVTSGAQQGFDGVVGLGCVIRGETYHFEIVANESSRGLTDLAIHRHIVIGNGILTVENKDQALARLQPGANHKGEDAARACLSLIKTNLAFQNGTI